MGNERIEMLLERAREGHNQQGHKIVSEEEQREYARIIHASRTKSVGEPEAMRNARFLMDFAAGVTPRVEDGELIVGSQKFTCGWGAFLSEAERAATDYHGNVGHIVVDYGRVLLRGVSGLRAELGDSPNRKAFELTLDAFSTFVRRHGCAEIAEEPPKSFHQAVQLTWFVQVFLHVESSCTAAISFGRLDQYLWPFLKADLRSGALDMARAEEILCCFWLKCCEGDESQNVILGGVDLQGRDSTNPLSLLCLDVTRRLKVWQPSVSVRVHPDSPQEFWDKALALCSEGIGMPSFFNDPVVVAALEKLDIPRPVARDWAVVGCTEATPQGNTRGLTVCGAMNLAAALLEYLDTPQPDSFATFCDGLKGHLRGVYGKSLAASQAWLDRSRVQDCSPFESLCLEGCAASGLTAEEGGANYNILGMNLLGLGTLVDSLVAIRELVFERRLLSLPELRSQVKANFPDERILQAARSAPGKYGSDAEPGNSLAADFSRFLATMVLESRLDGGKVRPNPGFFQFGADIGHWMSATPDGRRDQDRLSYASGPSELCDGKSVTSILGSAALLPHELCSCGDPLMLSFPRADIAGEDGKTRLRQVVGAFFAKGGFHLQINVVDAAALKDAKLHPERHPELTVRISGYSARFTRLGVDWQDAIIARTEQGV